MTIHTTPTPRITTALLRALLLLPLLLLVGCGEDTESDPEEVGAERDSAVNATEAEFRMTLDPQPDLPMADASISSDTVVMKTPAGELANYSIPSARIIFKVKGDRVGRVEHIFRDYGRFERRVDSIVPMNPNDPAPQIHELAITTPTMTGSYSFLSKQGWQMPLDSLYAQYRASGVSDSLSLSEFQLQQSQAKRLADTTVNGYETRVYRIDQGAMTITLWIWRGLPIRVHHFVPANDLEFTFEPVSIDLDVATPDELFTFPKGAAIMKRQRAPMTAPAPGPAAGGPDGA